MRGGIAIPSRQACKARVTGDVRRYPPRTKFRGNADGLSQTSGNSGAIVTSLCLGTMTFGCGGG